MKAVALPAAKWIVSIGLVVWLLSHADLGSAIAAGKQANLTMVTWAIGTMAFGLLVRSYKWQVLLQVQNVSVPLRRLHQITYMAMFFNNFFLGSIGGDAFRYYKAVGYEASHGGAASSVIMDRATGFVAALCMVLGFGIVGIPYGGQFQTGIVLVYIALCGALTLLGLLILLALHATVHRFALLSRLPKVNKVARELGECLRAYGNHRRVLLSALSLSFVFHFTRACSLFLLTIAANADVSLLSLLFISPLVGILVLIPVSMNGIGIQEGSYVVFLEQLGVYSGTALVVAVLARFLLLFFGLVGGLIFAISKHGSSTRRERSSRSEAGLQ